MKQALHYLAMFSLFFYGCNNEPEALDAEMAKEITEAAVEKGQVEFGFNSLLANTSKTTSKALQSKTRTTTSTIKDQAVEILLSIVDASDNPVYTNEILTLVRVEEDILSPPLSFTPGDYKITLFQVLDASHTAIAMTPQASSTLSGLVSNPLAVDFTVTVETTERVNLEVLPTTQQTAGDFGYSTFSFTEIRLFPFLMSVFAYDTKTTNFELVSSTIAITHLPQAKTYYQGDYAAETLTFQIPETQSTDLIEIVVSKDGYQSQTLSGTIAELKEYFEKVPQGKGPMVITLLEKAEIGLLIHLDASIPSSHDNGNSWKDLSENKINFQKHGNVVWQSTGGGRLFFNGGYLSTETDYAFKDLNVYTFEIWHFPISRKGAMALWLNNAILGRGSAEDLIMLFSEPSIGSTNRVDSNIPLNYSGWNHNVITVNKSKKEAHVFHNGEQLVPYSQGSFPNVFPEDKLENKAYIGLSLWDRLNLDRNVGVGDRYEGYISIVRYYTKELTPNEVKQSFNKDKSRHGL